MNTRLKKDSTEFLGTYYSFNINTNKTTDSYLIIDGVIDIVDTKNVFWNSYDVRIAIPKLSYPNVMLKVYEISTKIERDKDFHISEEGECCLDIYHRLKLEARRGITLVEFYKKYIYPFFANHQFKLKTEAYAGEEYEHDVDGVVQFYKEEFNLVDYELIIKYIECSLGIINAERNKQCPICGSPKYKKCCLQTIEKLKAFGKEILKLDLEIFNNMVVKPST